MYILVFVYKVHEKWKRQISRFLYKMVVKHCLRILSMYSRCNYSHSNLFILCSRTANTGRLKPTQPDAARALAERFVSMPCAVVQPLIKHCVLSAQKYSPVHAHDPCEAQCCPSLGRVVGRLHHQPSPPRSRHGTFQAPLIRRWLGLYA
jgi:hypothetical protein